MTDDIAPPLLEKRPLAFSGEEYVARLASVRVEMEAAGLDALIVTDPANMCWLTGYDGWSFYVHQAVVMTLSGPPLWWGRPMDRQGARFTAWMNDSALFAYSDDYVQNPEKHPYSHLAGLLQDWGLGRARIGVELDNFYFTAACVGQLLAHAPNAQYLDATGLVNWRRIIKSPDELKLMRRAATLVENAHAMIREHIRPGLRKAELVAEIYATLTRGDEDEDGYFAGDYPAIAPLCPSGAEASAAHLTWDDHIFTEGEATFFEIAGAHRRYHCPQSRTVFLGTPPDALRRAEAATLEGIAAVLEAARPGATAEDAERAWRETLARHGMEKESRIGYSVGLAYPPDWGERTLSLRPGDRTELIEGMTLHLIPSLWQEDFGLEITETFLVGPNGGEPLCRTPRDLFVVD